MIALTNRKKISALRAPEKGLMPAVIEAVKAYATVGEITAVLKEVYGEYQEPVYF